MGWFDKQVRLRKQNDQSVFEESIFRMASVVLGRSGAQMAEDGRLISKAAIDEILKYYRFKPAEIPDSVKDVEEQLEYCLRPHGIMRRNIRLEETWYREAFGPILVRGFLKQIAAENGKGDMTISEPAMAALRAARWPGNIRELRNCVENMVVLCRTGEIGLENVPMNIRESSSPGSPPRTARAT